MDKQTPRTDMNTEIRIGGFHVVHHKHAAIILYFSDWVRKQAGPKLRAEHMPVTLYPACWHGDVHRLNAAELWA